MITKTWQDGNLLDGLLPIKSHDPLITLSSEITCRNKTISTTTVLFATKHYKVVTHHEELPRYSSAF